MSLYLKSVDDLHPAIKLKPDEVVSIGRSANTGISDKNVSKLHLLAKYQPAKNSIICKQLGKHASIINGTPIQKDTKARVSKDCEIHLLPGKYIYTITDCPADNKRHSLKRDHGSIQNKGDSSTANKKQRTSSILLSQELKSMILSKVKCLDDQDSVQNGWVITDDIIVKTVPSCTGSSKIAGFDLDHTIITTQSGNVFPKNVDDWMIMWPHKVIPKLKEYHNDGYKLVFLTNQNGIEKRKITIKDFQQKIEKIIRELKIPIQVLAAPRSTATRKPCPGLWFALEKYYNDGIDIDTQTSFYVGDAAGRKADWEPKKKKDFSSSDREFARNVGIDFHTPDSFFLGHSETDKWDWKSFNSSSFLSSVESAKAQIIPPVVHQEMVLLVGYPGSGKSTFCQQYLSNYTRVNMDDMKSFKVCTDAMENAFKSKKNVVVDNTFADVASRNKYIVIAQTYNVACRCFIMKTTMEHAKHNNKFRRIVGRGVEVPGVVFNTYKSRYQEPAKSEGFSEILNVNFEPKFTQPHFKELYGMFLGG